MRHSAWSDIVVSLYMTGTAAPYTSWRPIAAWSAVMAASQLGRVLLMRAFNQRPRLDPEMRRWAAIYTGYMVVTGAIWGSTIYLFAHPDQPVTVALTMCCLYAIAAGSVPANAYNPPGLLALVGLMFIPVVVRLIAVGSLEYSLLGIASGLYALSMAGMCRVQARTLDEGFRIRFENRELLEALTVQTNQAEAARHKAELASLAKSQFLAAASHDLRQPLYALSLFSASLDELRLDGEARAVVANIHDSISAMEGLFNGLLDISKLEAGVVQPRLGPVSIDALFDRLSQYFRPIALDKKLDLRFHCDGEWVNSDAALLEQVLGNLVANALRCTHRGGVLVAARRGAAGVRLDVWDTGIGIAKADCERIFEEFVQVGNVERDRRRGLGLGLSIARRSGALIGASISVSSRPGRGSRFGFTQPCAEAPPAVDSVGRARLDAPQARPIGVTNRAQGLVVLIVDDDRDVRLALSNLLRQWGVAFDAAADGPAALALIAGGTRYDLVLADYRLAGGINGLDLIAAIAAQHPAPAPKAALITADFDPALIAAAGLAGIPIIPKPVRPPQLRALLGVPVEA
jgi:signal transduction histidine kinase